MDMAIRYDIPFNTYKFGSDRIGSLLWIRRLRHDIATTKKKKCKFKCSINMYCYHVCLCIIIINVCKYIPCELNRIETIFLSINGFPVPFTSSPRPIDRIYRFLYCCVVQLYRPLFCRPILFFKEPSPFFQSVL